MSDKQLLLRAKSGAKTANDRLDTCGKALRATVTHGISKLKANTVRAVIDHIIDILPDRDGEFFQPLARDYTQTLVVLLGYPVHVENLAVLGAAGWEKCVDFIVDRISRLVGGTDSTTCGTELVSRDTPAPVSGRQSSVASLNGRSGTPSQRGSTQPQQNDLVLLMQGLLSLVSASNGPCITRGRPISHAVFQILRLRGNFGRLQRMAFATLNCILLQTAGDDPTLGRTITTEVLPLLSYCWQPRVIDNDELLFSVRDEILKTIQGIRLYLDRLLQDGSSPALLSDVEDLLDNLWAEYSQRSQQSRLRLEDLTFSSLPVSPDQFSTPLFALRPFTQEAERRWALIETMSRLEVIFLRHARASAPRQGAEVEQPRKKQRLASGSHRLQQKMLSSDGAVKLTALQLLPFFLPRSNISEEDFASMVDNLMAVVSDKQGVLSSWAMIACAR